MPGGDQERIVSTLGESGGSLSVRGCGLGSPIEMGINPLHFAHDPVVFLDLFLGIPDNVADCSCLLPK
jgi:hypothetical protein